MDFWDITNQQDWHACESVQGGPTSPHAVAGPLSAEEDAVYQFVTMVARGYQGQPVWNPAARKPGPPSADSRRAARRARVSAVEKGLTGGHNAPR